MASHYGTILELLRDIPAAHPSRGDLVRAAMQAGIAEGRPSPDILEDLQPETRSEPTTEPEAEEDVPAPKRGK